MLIEFFLKLKEGGVPVSIKEFLTLIEALAKRVAFGSMEEFYYLARASLVKDEKYYDRYDRVFAAYFKGIVAGGRARDADPGGMAEEACGENPDRGGEDS